MNKPIEEWNQYWGKARDFGLGDRDRIDPKSYTCPKIFEAEKEKIFRKTWLMVARVSEIAEPGDYIKREIWTLDTEVVIVRGKKDGVIRAFYNACAHRGVALVRECSGRTGLFTCPYHAWSFGTDGKLVGLPGAEDFPQVDKATTGLAPIHCDVWNDHIFLNFADEPKQSLKDYMGEFGELFSDMPFGEYTHAVDIIQDLPTNWKNFLDAFNEGYHVQVLHPKSLPMVVSRHNPLNHMYDQILMAPHSSATIQSNLDWVPDGKVTLFVYASTGVSFIHVDGPEGGATRPRLFTSAKGINRIDLPNYSTSLLNFFPLSQMQVLADRYMWFQFWPLSPDVTRYIVRMFFARKPASYREAFAEAFMLASTRDVVTEDVSMTRMQQIGLKSGGVKQLYLGENEPLLRFMNLQIQDYLNAED